MKILKWFRQPKLQEAAPTTRPKASIAVLPPPPPIIEDEDDYRRTAYN